MVIGAYLFIFIFLLFCKKKNLIHVSELDINEISVFLETRYILTKRLYNLYEIKSKKRIFQVGKIGKNTLIE